MKKESSARTDAQSSTTADNSTSASVASKPNVGSSMVEKSLMLLTALLNGKELEKHHAEKDSPWYKEQVSCLRCDISDYDGRVYFNMGGWGTAFGRVEDRIIEIIKNPQGWEVSNKNSKK